MYIKNRLLEIKEHIGPLAKSLGVKQKLEDDGMFYRVVFEKSGAGKWRAPVEILFPHSEMVGKDEADWADVMVVTHGVQLRDVGNQGWSYYDIHYARSGAGPGNKEVAIARASEGLRDIGHYYPMEKGLPGLLENDDLVETFFELGAVFNQEMLFGEFDGDVFRNEGGYDCIVFSYDDYDFELTYSVGGNTPATCVHRINQQTVAISDGHPSNVIGQVLHDLHRLWNETNGFGVDRDDPRPPTI